MYYLKTRDVKMIAPPPAPPPPPWWLTLGLLIIVDVEEREAGLVAHT